METLIKVDVVVSINQQIATLALAMTFIVANLSPRYLSPLGARGKGGKLAIVKIMTFVMPKDRYTYASACILP